MKITQKIFTIAVIALLASMGLVLVLRAPEEFSQMENRYLTKFPKITWEGILSGDVQSQVEKACADQLPARDNMVSLHVSAERRMGKKDSGGVYFGKDHTYLEKVLDSDLSMSKYETLLKVAERIAGSTEGDTTVMLSPSHSSIRPDLLPAGAQVYNADKYYALQDEVLEKAAHIDLRSVFEENKGSQLYFKTDHHWTSYGAYLAAAEYLKAQGLEIKPYEEYVETDSPDSDTFLGTLYSKAPDKGWVEADSIFLPRFGDGIRVTYRGQEHDSIYDPEKLSVKDKYAVYFGGNYDMVRIDNPSAAGEGGHLCVIKDSYANSLVPYLIPYYDRIDMVDARYYSESFSGYLEEEKPDHVLICYELSNFITDGNMVKLLK